MATWHVKHGPTDAGDKFGLSRPCWGTGSGDEDNPFAGLDDPALAAAMQPGDTIYIRGFMQPKLAQAVNISNTGWKPPAGVSGKPTIIRGDYPGEPGIISGLSVYTSLVWSGPTDNVWNITFASSARMMDDSLLYEDLVGTGLYQNFSRLVRVADLPTCTATPGSFFWNGSALTLYVRPNTTANPADRIAFSRYGWWLGGNADTNPPSAHVLYYGVTFLAPRWLTWKAGRNLEFRQCAVLSCPSIAMADVSGGGEHVYDRCTVDLARGGYYSTGTHNTGNITIARSIFRDIGTAGFYPDADSHAVAAQNANGLLVKENVITSCGKPFSIWIASAGVAKNITVKHNTIRNSHNAGGAVGYNAGDGASVIYSFATVPSVGNVDSVSFEFNHVTGPVAASVHFQVVRNKWPYAVTMRGNVFDGNGAVPRIITDNDTMGVHFLRANVLANPTQHFIYMNGGLNQYNGDDNQYIGVHAAWFRGSAISTLAAWQALGATFDPGAFYGQYVVDSDGKYIIDTDSKFIVDVSGV